MKLLLDSCVWGGVRSVLEAAGHEVIWAGDWPEDPGDQEILARAFAEGRTLLTLDKDFGELAVARGARHCGIVRLARFGVRQQASAALEVLARHGDELHAGAIVTAEPGVIRIRLSEPSDD